MPMSRDEFRSAVLADLDEALQHTWVISLARQGRLRAMRSLLAGNNAILDAYFQEWVRGGYTSEEKPCST